MFRIGSELVVAGLRAEMEGLALMLKGGFAGIEANGHAAHRVGDCFTFMFGACIAARTAATATSVSGVFTHGRDLVIRCAVRAATG